MNNIQDTKYFHYYNANPKNRNIGDCAIRAASLFLDISWEDALRLSMKNYLKTGCSFPQPHSEIMNDANIRHLPGIELFLEENKEFRLINEKEYASSTDRSKPSTVKMFIENYAKEDRVYFISTMNHCIAVKNRKVWDTFDSSNYIVSRAFEFA